MTPKQFYRQHLGERRELIEQVAKDAGTTFDNFKQIAIARGSVSARLARELERASNGEMSLNEILFPDEPSDSAA